MTQLGDDPLGSLIHAQLTAAEGVDMSCSVIKPNEVSASTYVVADQTEGTRTCFATVPEVELEVEYVRETADKFLLREKEEEGNEIGSSIISCGRRTTTLLVLDGRHTLAAIEMATRAKLKGIPILLDVERFRPHIEQLLPLADYIVTNSAFPLVYTERLLQQQSSFPNEGDNKPSSVTGPYVTGEIDMHQAMYTLLLHTGTRFVITTNGKQGATLLRRLDSSSSSGSVDVSYDHRVQVTRTTCSMCVPNGGPEEEMVEIFEASVWPVNEVVDTTGAGDAFIGGIVYGLAMQMDVPQLLTLAAFVAAGKVSACGPDGLPKREQVPSHLLEPSDDRVAAAAAGAAQTR